MYRHRQTGLVIPLRLRHRTPAIHVPNAHDLTRQDPDLYGKDAVIVCAIKAHFEYVGETKEAIFREHLSLLLDTAGPDARIFLLLANDAAGYDPSRQADGGPFVRLNTWVLETAASFP